MTIILPASVVSGVVGAVVNHCWRKSHRERTSEERERTSERIARDHQELKELLREIRDEIVTVRDEFRTIHTLLCEKVARSDPEWNTLNRTLQSMNEYLRIVSTSLAVIENQNRSRAASA